MSCWIEMVGDLQGPRVAKGSLAGRGVGSGPWAGREQVTSWRKAEEEEKEEEEEATAGRAPPTRPA